MKRLGRTSAACAVLLSLSLIPVWTVAEKHSNVVAEAFTARNLARGSVGDDVTELQHRLKFLGYYHGKVDGDFRWQTYWAVRNFQSAFGLPVNGFVDMKTKMKLVAATQGWHDNGANSGRTGHAVTHGSPTSNPQPSPAPSSGRMPTVPGVSQSDVNLMAHVVYGEARGEPRQGEVAIAAVILNRMRDPRFPHSVPAIIYQPGAFTAVADGQVNLPPDEKARVAVEQAVHGADPSRGAVYYYNPATATSPWIWSRPKIVKIGKHIFCR